MHATTKHTTPPGSPAPPSFDDVADAARRLAGKVEATAVTREDALGEALGCRIWLKWENHQPTGAFKLRGASNAVARLAERGDRGPVATHSSGNHGAALACAAQRSGREAWIVMPENAVGPKLDLVKRFGGRIVACSPTQKAREAGLEELVQRGMTPIPPYDHPDVIAGQGTAALEFLREVPELERLVTPVGGGGLLAGTAITADALAAGAEVFGAEPAGGADTHASFRAGRRQGSGQPDTVADGLRAQVGGLTFPIIHDLVDDILLASDPEILEAMRLVYECTGEVIEPSSAVAVAVVSRHRQRFAGRRVGLVITGGNVDRRQFPWLGRR